MDNAEVTSTADEALTDTVKADPTGQADLAAQTDEAAPPRGAFIFVMLMLAGYVIYWFATWFTVFVERGGG